MGTYMEKAAHDWTNDSVRIIATPSLAAKTTYFYVQEVGHFRTLPAYFTERQHLNSFLVVYTLAGKGYLRYGNREYELRTVAAIASQTGMDNVSHFINLFKQRVEMTPLAYRKKWQRVH